jgi:hypothetical protein
MRFFAIVFMLSGSLTAAPTSTPAEWLAAQPKPAFKAGHTLPPLTRFGWDMDDAVRIALAEDWGYALEFGVAGPRQVENALTKPESREARLLALAIADPQRYPLCVASSRELPKQNVPPEVWTRDAAGLFLNAKAQSLDGNAWQPDMPTVYSPAAPDSFWQQAGELSAAPLRRLRERCRIAIVLNPGEYGLGVPGFAQAVWEQDPHILHLKGALPWPDFISQRKAHFQSLMTQAERAAAPDRLLYLFYTCGGGTNRNVFPGWADWSDLWEHFNSLSDLPSNEAYYRHLNTGWTGERDMLTLCLNAAAREIIDGRPLSYNWLSAGWEDQEGHSHGDLARWAGFLKCYYTAGMIGGNAGYYQFLGKNGFSKPFLPDQPPHWLQQLTTLAHVHGLFSHIEDFLRHGDLLPGPDKHRISKDLPAYEFPTGDATVRVLARKHRDRAEWLVTAWAADGDARDVTVNLPELAAIKLTATPDGAVYRVTIKDGQPQAKSAF